jgi:hypothetical protein
MLDSGESIRDFIRRLRMLKFKTIGRIYINSCLISILMVLVFSGYAYAVEWAKVYGGIKNDMAYAIQQTADGGYVVAGSTESFGAGSADIWILKLDGNGSAVWQKTYGGGGNEYPYLSSVNQTEDGGYVVSGYTESFGAGNRDIWILKLDSNGETAWQKTYGDAGHDYATSVQQTTDGGYVISGHKGSGGASEDGLIQKINANGDVIWQKTYAGSDEDYPILVQQTTDNGYIMAGYTMSFGAGNRDSWILKLDADGNTMWQKTYGGSNDDRAYSINQTTDGGYIVAGQTSSFGASGVESWILKLDSNGDTVWQKSYGGAGNDYALSVQQTADSGYIVAGQTSSFGASGYDSWILKLDNNGNSIWQKRYGGAGNDLAYSVQQTTDGGYIVAGSTQSFGAGGYDFWILKLDGNGNINNCSSIGMNSTNATIVNTNAIPLSPLLVGLSTNVTTQNTGVTGSVPNVSTTTQCVNTGNALTVTKAGAGIGTVTSSPGGINCGSDCSESYSNSTQVTLTAAPSAGSTFTGWSGDSDCTDGLVTMTADKTCTATFNIATSYLTLTITKTGSGSGTVTSNPGGINCGSDCSESYGNNTQVTLVAISSAGSTFAGWSGDSDCSDGLVTMTTDKTCTAIFNALNHTLTVTKTGAGSGTITSSPEGINCGSDCTESYIINAQVTLTANTAAGSTFEGWSGCDSTNGTACFVTMDGDKTVTANYGNIPCSPVYRFWSDIYLHHFYTISETEKNYVITTWPNIWRYEGPVFCAFTSEITGASPVYRFWSEIYSQHFYTISESERDYVIATWPGIWKYEGPVFYAFSYHAEGTDAVDRFWSDIYLGHFYTISETEKIYILETWPNVWLYEGTVFYALPIE